MPQGLESGAIDRLAEFASAETEAAFRDEERPLDAKIVRASAAVAVLAHVPFGFVDFVFQQRSPWLYVLLATRVVFVAVAVVVGWGVPKLASSVARDRVLLGWAVSFAVLAVPINLARPPSFGGPLAVMLVMAFAFALVVPMSFKHQLAAVLSLASTFVASRLFQGSAGAATLASTAGVVFTAVALMLFASLRLHRSRRQTYFALYEQRSLRVELERAIAEIRTLRGIVPICSVCHKIRDESGDWQHVDAYVAQHTHAEFSHSYCDVCAAQHFPRDRKRASSE